ncbi:divergent polysaccharide deacetylase family protein [Cohnella faecalis]|uniref:Divergent polysaccharide deacetylase family protein n=1 Tax=Cohnella faecalis TaxID=2315694 RepID=A0A398CNH0_9BACL|nr:divergent polysaccharide deacetylase family protein [Cohnella faecalis]RIE00464.1 divergent polysaccharide deacetylase family protein [Cohnella faecalis]
MKKWQPISIALVGAFALAAQAFAEPSERPQNHSGQQSEARRQIAVVIDDFGNNMKGTQEMLDLPIKLTVAVMPFLPTTKQDAEAAFAKGHDVIVHMPMEPISGKKSWLGPGAILTDLPDAEIRRRVEAAIKEVPHAVGMNNHMGSRVTADARVMRIVLEVCKEHGLFFLDSRTSFRTVVPKVAKEVGLQVLGNDVFLDDVYSSRHVAKQIAIIRKFLQSHPTCVVIGHVGSPGLVTSGALKSAIPALKSEAEFVKVSQLLPTPVLPTERKNDTR